MIFKNLRNSKTFLIKAFMGICCLVFIKIFLTYATQSEKLWMSRFRQTIRNNREAVQNKTGNTPDKGIPKIIHQIWNTDVIPVAFHDNIIGLASHNKPPDWQYYFWTLSAGEQFIREQMPGLLQRYMRAPNLLKADILRLVVLYHYGGVYFDLDTVSVKPLDSYVESHDCSLVTDPLEHVFSIDKPKPKLLITNSAILCSPSNWFILHVIKQLEKQPSSCRDAVSCTGPNFISMHYGLLNATNKSHDLPPVDNYEYFEDMVAEDAHRNLEKHCVEPFTHIKYEWSRNICKNWIKRGRDKRKISDRAYTYHTWFHTYFYHKARQLREGAQKNIRELVPNVVLFKSNKSLQ